MKAVGIRELKSKLSQYLRAVKAGDTVLVTERGQVIAEIVRPGGHRNLEASGELPLVRLGRLVTVTRGASNDPAAYPRTGVQARAGTAQKLIDDERDG